ncbi:MAG: hypothetical protein FWC58_12135 [Desulfobulbus sp.]|nr:hypothetical protein [Desulfobulbus sp.]
MNLDCTPHSGTFSFIDWLIVIPVLPLPVLVLFDGGPWNISWGKLPQVPVGLYFLYAAYAVFHVYGCNWVIPVLFCVAAGFFINAFLQRPNR